MTKVNQVDRAVAVEAYLAHDKQCDLGGVNPQFLRDIIEGERDDDALLQAFAAHRVATEARIVDWLREIDEDCARGYYSRGFVYDIERQEHLK
jgi:hypothetical protein